MAIVVIILILNSSGHVAINFGLFKVHVARAAAYFSFTTIGIIIGILLK
jgi:hypothetical protein